MSGAMCLWATVSTLTGITHDFKGLLLTRFFLGITEAPFYPGALYMLSIFYTKKEIATRISILFTGNICGTAFAGLIAIGVFRMSGIAGLSGWRWLFILQGVITFVISMVSGFILPDEPLNTRWLTRAERELAHARMQRDTVELRENTPVWAGLREAASDPRLWVLTAMQHFHMAASNYKNFFPTIVETLGFGQNATLALTCPPYIIAGVISIAWSISSGLFFIHIYIYMCVQIYFNADVIYRPYERTDMAHHVCKSHCSDGLRARDVNAQRRGAVFRHVRLRNGRLLLQLDHPGLGSEHLRANEGEKGIVDCNRQHGSGDFDDIHCGERDPPPPQQHLFSTVVSILKSMYLIDAAAVSLARLGRAPVSDCDVNECCVFGDCSDPGVGVEDDACAGEPEDTPVG